MLRDLTIQNYRCFKDFHIDGLARVNLIVGMNNSGKTSLLEAVYLLVNQDNQDNDVASFLSTNYLGFDKLSELWSRITLTPKEDKVIEALRILEPRLEHISFTSQPTLNGGSLVKLRGQPPTSLGSMGGGMRRILALAMSAVTVENGFLLVDEIENSLYYDAQTDMWRFVIEVAKQLNLQVFATTHSWDCIAAFQEALEQSEDSSVGKLFRLSWRDDHIRPVTYTSDELAVAVPHSIEVR